MLLKVTQDGKNCWEFEECEQNVDIPAKMMIKISNFVNLFLDESMNIWPGIFVLK